MGKRGLLLGVLLVSGVAWAEREPLKDYSLTCGSEAAGMAVWTEEGKVHLRWENGAGKANIPVYSGTLTSSMLPLALRASKDLKVIERVFEVTWDLKNCVTDSERPVLISCHGENQISEPQTKNIVVTSLSTTATAMQNINVADKDGMNISFDVGINTTDKNFAHYFIQFAYTANHCGLGKGKRPQNPLEEKL